MKELKTGESAEQQQTTERSLSEYIRNVSMQKPVTVKYRKPIGR